MSSGGDIALFVSNKTTCALSLFYKVCGILKCSIHKTIAFIGTLLVNDYDTFIVALIIHSHCLRVLAACCCDVSHSIRYTSQNK